MVRERTQDVQEEAEKVQAILSSMADGVLVTDAEGRLVTANAAAEELLGFRWTDVAYQPVSRSGLTHPMWEHVAQMIRHPDQPGNVVVEFPSPVDDSPQIINARAAPIRLNHDIIGVVIVLRDITALKEVERMKARFIAGVTHELKTPLSIIKLHVENLLAYYDRLPAEKQMELLHTVQNQTGLLDRLIDDVLTLSRLDTVHEAEWQTVNLPELVGGVVEELRALAQARNLTLTWQASEELPVPVIPDQFERAVRNLVDNAIKYTPAGGEIQVAVRQELADDQPRIRIEVRDTGIGIPPEHQQRIFDHFYRVDTSHTTPGTGLGLSIVREIVNAHGGSLHVESTPGAGSVFTILLPLHTPADTERAEQ
ncbi:MAG: PAS domain-containing protein [Chloroflexi bacterium]|nr:MAG: PAS domain-containing protein [Chloroflexota bacterium]